MAKRLRTGKAVGVDIWNSRDVSGNDPTVTKRNAAAEGVADRIGWFARVVGLRTVTGPAVNHSQHVKMPGGVQMRDVVQYYTGFGAREWSRLDRDPWGRLEFVVNWHYINHHLPTTGHILDNGAGPGKYAMKLAEKGLRVTLADLTPKLVEIARQKADEFGLSHQFVGFHVANACDLSLFDDEAFDAALMLGPLYHLQQADERERAVQELYRVTKPGGHVFVAFRSRLNHTLTSLLHPEHWQPNNTMDEINQFLETGVFNHRDSGRFTGAYFFEIEAIKPFMEANGFASIDLIGSTNIGVALNEAHWQYWWEKEEADKLEQLLIQTARDPYVLGMSSHLLYIGSKRISL